MIGSRDAARAAAKAAEIGASGAGNADAVRGVDLVVLAVKADAALPTAAALAEAIGETPVLSVASELRFTQAGRPPGRRGDVDRRADPGSAARSRRGWASFARRRDPRAGEGGRRRARLRRRSRGEGACARARRESRRGTRARRRPAGERAGARGDDGRDRQPQQALPWTRRRARRRPAVSFSVFAVTGLPELRDGDDLAALIVERAELEDGDVVVVAQKAISKIEGRIVHLDGIEPSERAVEIAGDEGDPRRIEVILGEARRVVRVRAAAHHLRDASRLHLRLRRRRRVEHARARHARVAAGRPRPLRRAAPRRRCSDSPGRTSASSSPTRSAVRGARARPTSASARPESR